MSNCSCKTCMKEFCRNIWVRIAYTILIFLILATGIVFFMDGLTALKPFELNEEVDVEGAY